jgi:hypothetical protein
MWLPRVRFTLQQLMIVVPIVAVTVFVPIMLPEAVWVGFASIPLEFLILDASTGQPIEGATIRLTESTPEYQAVTGPDGRARLTIEAVIAGRSSLARDTRTVNYHWMLLVTAGRHRELREDLGELTRSPRYHSDPVPPPIVIRLGEAR